MHTFGTTNISLFHRQLSTLFFCKYRLDFDPKENVAPEKLTELVGILYYSHRTC
jgi:hypothetical protein